MNIGVVFAVNVSNFPSCTNPQGELIASYDTGIHGVVGHSEAYSGSDRVYLLDNGNYLQCLCTESGNGVQTNWWKVSSLTEDEITTLKNLGWHYIPSGEPWGLAASSYMAQNVEYSCKSSSNGGGGNGSGSASDGTGGQILASAASTSSDVLGLAATGNIKLIYTLLLLGFVSVGLRIALKRQ